MLKWIVFLVLACVPWMAAAQTNDDEPVEPPDGVAVAESGLVTVRSKGDDVRDVLFELFDQSERNFAMEPNIRFVLYLSLVDVEFEEALEIVVGIADLDYEIRDGIYYVAKRDPNNPLDRGSGSTGPTTPPPPEATPSGRLTDTDLRAARLTTRMPRADIREVFAEFERQTEIKIEVSDSVPNYRVDSYMIRTSLKFAMDAITRSAGLVYRYTDRKTILVDVPGTPG